MNETEELRAKLWDVEQELADTKKERDEFKQAYGIAAKTILQTVLRRAEAGAYGAPSANRD